MTPTAEERERDRIRYANMTEEQRQARLEHNREAKARRARERYAAMTPEEKAARLAQIHASERSPAEHYTGNGIPDLPILPLVRYCPACGARLTECKDYCDAICKINYERAGRNKPLPATVGVFHRHERIK